MPHVIIASNHFTGPQAFVGLGSRNHYFSPFKCAYHVNGQQHIHRLGGWEKTKIVAIALFIGMATMGFGLIPAFFCASAYYKARMLQGIYFKDTIVVHKPGTHHYWVPPIFTPKKKVVVVGKQTPSYPVNSGPHHGAGGGHGQNTVVVGGHGGGQPAHVGGGNHKVGKGHNNFGGKKTIAVIKK